MISIAQGRPSLSTEETQIICALLESGCLASGPQILSFEAKFAKLMNVPDSVSTSSGFAALHLALMTLGLKPGDEVIVPAISSCAAVRNAVLATPATPIFADTESEVPNLDPGSVEKSISARTRAIVCPHHLGLPSRVEEIVAMGIPVIEDCAQSLGATVQGRILGSFGYAAVFSFYPTKLMTTIDGGAIVSRDRNTVNFARDLRYYGQKNDDLPRLNYKMQNLHAAVGLVQLDKLSSFLTQRKAVYCEYMKSVIKSGENRGRALRLPTGGVAFRFGIFLDSQNKLNVPNPFYRREYQALTPELWKYPNAHRFLNRFVTFPIYPTLTEAEIRIVGEQIFEILS